MISSYVRLDGGTPIYTRGVAPDAWIVVENPDSEELDELADKLGVARDLLQDARDPFEVPRVQTEDGVVYVYMRMPQFDGERMVTVPVLLALGNSFLLTVYGQEPNFMEHYLDGSTVFSTAHRSQLLLKFWADINIVYQRALTEIGRSVRSTMADLEKVQNQDILRLVSFEGVLNDFIAALIPMHDSMGQIISRKYIKTYEEDEDLYEDVLLQSGQLIESSKSILKTTVNYRDAYSVIVNNNLNAVVKFLTAATVVLAFPTAIFSFYGMNVTLPIESHPFSWHIIFSLTALFSAGIIAYFARRRWF